MHSLPVNILHCTLCELWPGFYPDALGLGGGINKYWGAYDGVSGLCPQRGSGAEPLVRGSEAKPPEAGSFLLRK